VQEREHVLTVPSTFVCPADYLHYIASSAHQLALTSVLPFAASMLLCCSLIAVLSWAQSVELRLPITFYRTRSNHVRVTLNATTSTSAPHAATYCRIAITELQVQQEHPLIQALCKRDVQHCNRTVEFALDVNNEQRLLMRLSPSGARSLLFANFWAALLQTPLRCAAVQFFTANAGALALQDVAEHSHDHSFHCALQLGWHRLPFRPCVGFCRSSIPNRSCHCFRHNATTDVSLPCNSELGCIAFVTSRSLGRKLASLFAVFSVLRATQAFTALLLGMQRTITSVPSVSS
jgi:hypothetical protein